MPSASLSQWKSARAKQLDEIESAHASVGGRLPGRRFATQQINHAYAMLLSSQFQGFCRDLHSECVDCLVRVMTPVSFRRAVLEEFFLVRKLDTGNPNPGNIGADFSRLDLDFRGLVYADHGRNNARREHLDSLNQWRNAIAHQDFDPARLGGTTTLHLSTVRAWRTACDGLATSFDRVMSAYITRITGSNPW
jgi:hypothetical protein